MDNYIDKNTVGSVNDVDSRFSPADLPALKQIWKEGFGDTDEDIEAFFSLLFDPEAVYITRENGVPVSVMYLIEGLMLSEMNEGKPVKVTYLYALATAKNARGKGYGRRTVRVAADLAFSRGADIVALTPADAGLKKWYRENVGFPNDSLTKAEYERFVWKSRDAKTQFEASADSTVNNNADTVCLSHSAPCLVVFKRNFLELQELYSWGEVDVKDTVIYETRGGLKVPAFYWGPTLS